MPTKPRTAIKTPNVMLMVASIGRAPCAVRDAGGVRGCGVGSDISEDGIPVMDRDRLLYILESMVCG
jgi:hypothetical protein